MLAAEFRFRPDDQRYIESLPRRLRKGTLVGVRNAMFFGERKAKASFGQPGHLKARSGHLRRSIKSGLRVQSGGVVGWIFTDVIYGRIHELGGIIRPRVANYLKFQIAGRWVMTKKVRIPSRPYLKPAIADNINKIKDIIVRSIVKEF